MQLHSGCLLVLLFAVTAAAATTNSTVSLSPSRTGRCPTTGLREKSQCPDGQVDECLDDDECKGDSKCCTDGCRNVCVMPLLTSCERRRVETIKRSRALGINDNDISLPECDPIGDFAPVQCDALTGHCYCVDEFGFEMAGTRARSLDLVNCSNPRPCSGLLCRMLCPYEFELDEDGCPLCQCRDPCKGIKCPGSQTCQLEEIPCAREPCAPVPTCKQARSLDSLCPGGMPLMMPGGERPFLCGTDPGKPKCPLLFDCVVQPGADYGTCCAAADKLQKAGTCPVTSEQSHSTMCGVPCLHDLECQGADKCCHDDKCGKHCIPPNNFTICLQQQKIAELLSVHERDGKGYIPQCREDGLYEKRQCSRNGLVCWCVDEQGAKIKGSMGPSDTVDCDQVLSNAVARSTCESALCAATCDYGFRTDSRGCATCECDDPCDNFPCAEGEQCTVAVQDNCQGSFCIPRPTCRPIFVPPCAFGKHLSNLATGQAVTCTVGTKFSCPTGYRCIYSLPNSASFCCPEPPKTEITKVGICPFVNDSLCDSKKSCQTDVDCPGQLKCCSAAGCGSVCAEPEAGGDINVTVPGRQNNFEDQGRLPSICEILRETSQGRRKTEAGYTPAILNPRCTAQGEFEDVQCDDAGQCWCADEYGFEIAGTRGAANQVTSCQRSRNDLECPGMLCRLGCDYGLAVDKKTNCPLCECRDPCDAVKCPNGQKCQMVSAGCDEDPFCPAVPYCVALKRQDIFMCDNGEPYINPITNDTVSCDPRSRVLTCPEGFSCQSDDDSEDGICCPTKISVKNGQCPFLVPVSTDTCENECISDEDCDGTLKCCSNGCGTQCVEPLMKTACQHMQLIMKYKARESGIPANRMFIPRCKHDDGTYEQVQCDPVTRACWCVGEDGVELAGTRTPPGLQPVCSNPRSCPTIQCSLDCQFGLQLDTSGCPFCACRNPCDQVHCRSEMEECRVVQVNCIREPCPPLPVCLPRLDNPCSHGQPLKDFATNITAQCGPAGSSCPSSHKCHLSPLGEFSVCCPKPRDICFQEKDIGGCKDSVTRWYFNDKRNKCEPFRYSGCGGNMNNFDSEGDCKAVCPVLSSCEKLREKNQKIAEKYKKVVFMPKCSHGTGDWEPIQCLEEVGICWCVDKDGEPIKGTLTRGTPICGVRQARQRSVDPPICEPGVTIHMCNRSMCDSKICLADPKATCRVNPCGGCNYAFYDNSGRMVDCDAGLSKCQREVQTVLNSEAWIKQGGPWNAQPLVISTLSGKNYLEHASNLDAYQIVHNEEDAEILPSSSPSLLSVSSRIRREADDVVSVTEAQEESTEVTQQQAVLGSDPAVEVSPVIDNTKEILPEYVTEQVRDNEPNDQQLVMDSTDGDLPEETTLVSRAAKYLAIDDGLVENVGNDFTEKDSISVDAADISQDPLLKELVTSSSTQRTIPALRDAIKPGFCPPVRSRTFLRVLAQFAGGSACTDQCISDADCPGVERCCPGECGSSCAIPVLLPTPLLPKPGTCPSPAYPSGCSRSEFSLQDECDVDADCSGRAKCCSNGCISICSAPEENDSFSLMMSVSPPVCTLKGDYAKEQSQGEFSWCVDTNGNPIDESLTRGSVRCSPNGTILEQRALGPVCTDPSIKATVCRDECLLARCPTHPDAICVADPCNDCQVSFIDAHGEPVDCTDRCSQPVLSGHCRASFQRYFFNATSGICEEFIYGGCEGNDNNFDTLEECQYECEKPVNVCDLPKEMGLCRGRFPRWYYNGMTQKCERFIFGGCGGNANNFYTKSQCENRCPDMVLCPQMTPDGEMKSCSRNTVCRNQVCPGHDDAVCTVDPCTCVPLFLDSKGQSVTCLPTLNDDGILARRADIPLTNETLTTTTDAITTTTSTSSTTTQTTTTMTTTTTTTTAQPTTTSSTEKQSTVTAGETTTTQLEQTTPTIQLTSRGKSLKESEHHTRCQKLRKAHLKLGNDFVVECDDLGRFKPMQCVPARPGQPTARCWCVDEAGNQVANTTLFAPGQRLCKIVPVTAVAVTLGFPPMEMDNSKLVELQRVARSQVEGILATLSAQTMEPKLEVKTESDGTRLTFTLIGDNKVDVASHLEDMVKSGHLLLDMDGHSMPADVTSSRFYHKLESGPTTNSNSEFSERTLETREILAQALDIEAPYLALIVVLSVLASIVICGIVIGLVLYRRHTTGTYPKGSLTMASPIKHKKSREDMDVVPRGFPRVGINPSDQHAPAGPQLSPAIPKSKRLNPNVDAW